MRGYLILRDNPYMAVSDVDGKFIIRKLPVGTHKFRVWHERVGWIKNAKFGAATSTGKGLNLRIREGVNPLGAVKLTGERFDLEASELAPKANSTTLKK